MDLKSFIIILVAVVQLASCSPTWYTATDGKRYYIDKDYKYNWLEAWDLCARNNLQLVTIESQSKNNALIELLKKEFGKPLNLWLGGTDEYNKKDTYSRQFFWTATGQKLPYSFWGDKNPDNDKKNEHCIHIWASYSTFQWNDNECTQKYGFICEENHHLTTYKKDLATKQGNVNNKNLQISQDFKKLSSEIENTNINRTQIISNIQNNLKISIQKVRQDTQIEVNKLYDREQLTIAQLMEESNQSILNVNNNSNAAVNNKNAEFTKKLDTNRSDVNKVLTW